MNNEEAYQIGRLVLFGSGETLASSGKTHEATAVSLYEPPRIAILETPAGFEPNSDRVAGKIAEFLARRLQNYKPEIAVLPARKRGTEFSPDNHDIVAPILDANWILLGPGSPSYGARQLRNSLAVDMIAARHQMGATLMLSSSSTLAFSTYTMPVYEIYKVGEDLHWKDGVNYFGRLGLPLVVIPHWDNSDGGEELDTSRCYMGRDRFNQLRELLPPKMVVLGIDEHTSLTFDFAKNECHVRGNGRVYILHHGEADVDAPSYGAGETFPATVFGEWHVDKTHSQIAPQVWQAAQEAEVRRLAEANTKPKAPAEVLDLLAQRTEARANKEWQAADALRDQITALGWQILDTPAGAELEPLA